MRKNIALLPVLLMLVACSTLYTGIVTITQVVDAGMKDWAQMSVAGKTSTAIDAKVVATHDKYRQACAVTQIALVAYKNSGDSTEYVKALASLRATVDELFALIYPLVSTSEASTLKANLAKASVP